MSLILRVKDLKIQFNLEQGSLPAVDGVSFDLHQGQILGLVGESGCGKSLSALALLKLIDPPGEIVGGEALYYGQMTSAQKAESKQENEEKPEQVASEEKAKEDSQDLTATIREADKEPEGGIDLLKLTEEEIRPLRGSRLSMIFQEPMTALNPVYRVGDQIAEVFQVHQKLSRYESWQKAVHLLEKVHMPEPERRAKQYPHELSGGMRQRVMIAMALSLEPDILIADEPTTALDVTIQAQILKLLQDLVEQMHMSVLLITHDLGVVRQVADQVAVLYAGDVIEHAPTPRLFARPKHPYTRGLLKSLPELFTPQKEKLNTIGGQVPRLGDWPSGCRFAPRCPRKLAGCEKKVPGLKYVGQGQELKCLNY